MRCLPIRQTLAACAVMMLAAAGSSLRAADAPKMDAPAAKVGEVLPKAETIIDRSIEATGGKAALGKLHNQVITGSMEMPAMGIKGTMVVTKAEPDKSLAEIEIAGLGSVKQGFDGKVAWEINPMQGARIKDGDELAGTRREAFFHEENWRDVYKKAETVGTETVDGRDCYKVVLTPNEGSPTTHYFDKKTGLLAKISLAITTPMGEMQSETLISDYRKEGDLLIPHKLAVSTGPQEITLTFESFKSNVDLPAGKFDLPDEIKALLKK